MQETLLVSRIVSLLFLLKTNTDLLYKQSKPKVNHSAAHKTLETETFHSTILFVDCLP